MVRCAVVHLVRFGETLILTNQGLDTTQVQHLHGYMIFFFVSCVCLSGVRLGSPGVRGTQNRTIYQGESRGSPGVGAGICNLGKIIIQKLYEFVHVQFCYVVVYLQFCCFQNETGGIKPHLFSTERPGLVVCVYYCAYY